MDKIVMGSDHAGYELKKEIISYLQKKGIEVEDKGPFSNQSVDYPDFIHPVAKKVEENIDLVGIIICGSGNGAAITANKHLGIRCALVWTSEIAKLAKQHNNANIISIPARFVSLQEAFLIIDTFLETKFEGGRHKERIDKITCF